MQIMEWPPSCSDVNPIKNIWSNVKIKLYECGKQYDSKPEIWEAIKSTMSKTEHAKVKKKSIFQMTDLFVLCAQQTYIHHFESIAQYSSVYLSLTAKQKRQ